MQIHIVAVIGRRVRHFGGRRVDRPPAAAVLAGVVSATGSLPVPWRVPALPARACSSGSPAIRRLRITV
jgi:hypothetical protein